MAYITSDTLAAYIGVESTSDDAILTDCITRAQTAIETACRRTFEAATETRYYREEDIIEDVNDRCVLMLDRDLLSVTTLTNGDGLEISSTYYELMPRNRSPKRYIRLKWTHSGWVFNDPDSVITVLGSWGYASTPPNDIVLATIRYATYLYKQKDVSDFEVSGSPEVGLTRVPMGLPKDVKALISPYMRREIA